MKKKKLLGTIVLGGLALSAPIAVFATDESTTDTIEKIKRGHEHKGGSLLDAPNEITQNQVDRFETMIEIRIENANLLIDEATQKYLSEEELNELKQIVEEFAELEQTLEDLDISEYQKEELREMFFEIKDETRDLSDEFKTIISEVFTDEEKEDLKEQMRENKKEMMTEAGYEMKKPRGFGRGERGISEVEETTTE